MVITGTHDGNLITNQDAIGKTVTQAQGEIFVELGFNDYLQQEISPTAIQIRLTNFYGTKDYTITNEIQDIVIGHRSGGGVHADVRIDNKQLVFTHTGTNSNVINSLGSFEVIQLDTEERSYNEFKFQD